MLAIISPAKDMKVLPHIPRASSEFTVPEFLTKSKGIITDLKRMKPDELSDLMKISDKLAMQNYDRFHNWKKDHNLENSSQAIFSFTGEVYRGVDAPSLSVSDVEYSQCVFRILSGLYCVIRPLDLIQEYRLEMGTKHGFGGKKNLYEFWKPIVAKTLNKAIVESPGENALINLASNEYFSSIDKKILKHKVITPTFYQDLNEKKKMIVVYAKKARGMMVRFIIENKIEKVEDLKAFNTEGYYFDNKRSTIDNWVFMR
ncbi:MAG: peroxide stress protein YaaA [Prolixibacteraceae bacterium]|jgi:cytoplasmic iron level regulating protein YaaA (DUF328/UPF0246 family)|nr:peroxide stress protein YaaA [Prolixibacteraceae bacterium]